jgi:hypothetical protein
MAIDVVRLLVASAAAERPAVAGDLNGPCDRAVDDLQESRMMPFNRWKGR